VYAVCAVYAVLASRTGFSRERAGLGTVSSERLRSPVSGYHWMRNSARVRA
jgi:hypothetical protein